jgi:alkaline phosphatase D
LAGALQQLIGPLVYADTSRRGYLLITATPSELRAQWAYADTVKSRSYQMANGPTLRTLPGAAGRTIIDAA